MAQSLIYKGSLLNMAVERHSKDMEEISVIKIIKEKLQFSTVTNSRIVSASLSMACKRRSEPGADNLLRPV